MKIRAEAIEEESGQTDCQHFVHPALCVVNTNGQLLTTEMARELARANN